MSNSNISKDSAGTEEWPSLFPLEEWKYTFNTLHMWTQIVGKIRLEQMPWINHSWHVTLYVTSRGMTTMPIPHGARTFQIDFDFIDHKLVIQASDGSVRTIPLRPVSVADFYGEVMTALTDLDLEVDIVTKPNEVMEPIPFEQDQTHASYEAEYVNHFWQAMVQSDRVMREFRSRFIGKCSPVHFFWGAFDLAVTRFSGRPAPEHPGGIPHLPDPITREAYSHEVSSSGFWPGGGGISEPAFYAYSYPEPDGFKDYSVKPDAAYYSLDLREFILPYKAVQQSDNPDKTLLEFLQSTYEAAANLANWDRDSLEQKLVL